MSRRNISLLNKAALCVSAFLLCSSPILAGDRVHSAPRPQAVSSSAVVRTVARSATVSVTLTPSDPAKAPKMVSLRGPDGKVQRFPLEGDVVVLTSSPVILRAGKTLTIYWVAAK